MDYIERENLPSDYSEMMKTETHHNHKIIKDKNGVLRWEEKDGVSEMTEPNTISLNDLIPLFHHLGWDRNSEEHRHLYRCMGYSLSGYWEVFYWDMNNDKAEEYRQPESQSQLQASREMEAERLRDDLSELMDNIPATCDNQDLEEGYLKGVQAAINILNGSDE